MFIIFVKPGLKWTKRKQKKMFEFQIGKMNCITIKKILIINWIIEEKKSASSMRNSKIFSIWRRKKVYVHLISDCLSHILIEEQTDEKKEEKIERKRERDPMHS